MKLVVLRDAFATYVRAHALLGVNSILATISKDGIESYEVDPAHVSALDASLARDAFEQHPDELPTGKATRRVDFDVDAMDRALSRAKSYSFVELRIDETKYDLALAFGSIVRNIKTYEIPAKDDEKPNLATWHPKNKVELDTKNLPVRLGISYLDLRLAIESAKDVSDHVYFFANENGLEVSAGNESLSNDVGEKRESRAWFPKSAFDADYVRTGNARSMFHVDFASLIVKSLASSDSVINRKRRVRLVLGNDYPIQIVSEIARREAESEIVERLGTLHFYLAPRIIND